MLRFSIKIRKRVRKIVNKEKQTISVYISTTGVNTSVNVYSIDTIKVKKFRDRQKIDLNYT